MPTRHPAARPGSCRSREGAPSSARHTPSARRIDRGGQVSWLPGQSRSPRLPSSKPVAYWRDRYPVTVAGAAPVSSPDFPLAPPRGEPVTDAASTALCCGAASSAQKPNDCCGVGFGAAGAAAVSIPSSASIRAFATDPPGAEKPPTLPPAASTRWHGTISGIGFARHRLPDVAGEFGAGAERFRHRAIGGVLAPAERADRVIDAREERRLFAEIDRDRAEIDLLASEITLRRGHDARRSRPADRCERRRASAATTPARPRRRVLAGKRNAVTPRPLQPIAAIAVRGFEDVIAMHRTHLLPHHAASWKMIPSVCRCPRRTRLTPWRIATR